MHPEVKDGGPGKEAAEELRLAILSAMGQSLAAGRRDFVAGRAAIGIENEWTGDGEFYQGYDDANRHEFVNSRSKPDGSGAAVEARTKDVAGSIVFPNITQPYCDAASARIGDMLLPTDDRNFAIEPTPIPDIFEGLDLPEATPAALPMMLGQPPQPGMPPEEAAGMAMPPAGPNPTTPPQGMMLQMPDGRVMDVMQAKAEFDKVLREAERKAEKAQTYIDDWLSESQYHGELRMVIDDCTQIGSGVIKGPVPVKRKSRKWVRGEDGVHKLIVKEEIKPASFRVAPWNLFPDPACGDSIHKGSGIWERDTTTGKGLEDLIGLPGYIESQIRMCLREGPARQNEADQRNLTTEQSKKSQFEIWHYHGAITATEMRAAGVDLGDGDDPVPDEKSYPAMITMVNDRVIRASLNPLDSGEFPYDVIPYKRRPGMPWGMGVARQMRTPQRTVVAAMRNLMDNAGLAAGPQLVLKRGVEPENGVWELKPLKMWVEGEDAEAGATSPVTAVVIPMILPELMSIIELGMSMAEKVTGLPMLLQGQQGSAPPDRVGVAQILNNNGNSLLRRVARLFDSCVTEPHIRRYYAWLMEYGEDDDAKGDFQVVARGSTALVERDIQSQEMLGIVQLSLNPAYGKNPAKAMDEFLKSRRFDPAAFDFTEEEKKQIAAQQPAPPPILQVTQMKEEGATQRKQMDIQAKQQDTQAQLQHDANEGALERQLREAEIAIDARLAEASVAADERLALGDAKVNLSTTAMKLKTQRELSARAEVMKPPTEPAGRAPSGQAFAR